MSVCILLHETVVPVFNLHNVFCTFICCIYHHIGGNVIDHNEALVNNDKGGGIYSEKVLSEVLNTVCLM